VTAPRTLAQAIVTSYDWRMDESAVVYIDRLYDDSWDVPQPWLRGRRDANEREWSATTGDTAEVDADGTFDTVEEAIAWGRERADVVFVRLGGSVEACYSAGQREATWHSDGTGWPFPLWPPSTWPDYDGAPEPGWPEFFW